MTTEKLIEIVGAALCDTLCEGCETEGNNEIFGSCFECRVQALKEIKNRLSGSILLGEKYPIKEYTMTMTNDNGENMFAIEKVGDILKPNQGIQGR